VERLPYGATFKGPFCVGGKIRCRAMEGGYYKKLEKSAHPRSGKGRGEGRGTDEG